MNFTGRNFFNKGGKAFFKTSRPASQAFFFSQNASFSAMAKQIARHQLVAAQLQMN
jgi:hypothetical protein